MFVPLFACREPTQVFIELRTKLRCSEITATAISVASTTPRANADFQSENFAALATECRNGELGSLLIVPGAAVGGVQVVVGAKALLGSNDVRGCIANPAACIFARRKFGFIPRETVTIPISLDPDCRGIQCSELSTCRGGSCVPPDVVCSGGSCDLPTDAPIEAGVLLDAGSGLVGDGDDAGTQRDGSATDASSGQSGAGLDLTYNMFCEGPSYCNQTCSGDRVCCRSRFSPSDTTCQPSIMCNGDGVELPSCCAGHCDTPNHYCSSLFMGPFDIRCRPNTAMELYYCNAQSDCPPNHTCLNPGPGAVGRCQVILPPP